MGHISEPLLISSLPDLTVCDDERTVIQKHLLERVTLMRRFVRSSKGRIATRSTMGIRGQPR